MNKEEKNIVPELRFPEFKIDGEWKETTLDDVADYENGKAHEKEISEKGKYKVVNSKFISTDGEVVKYTDSANLMANTGDILMVLSDIPNGKAIAKCFYVDKEKTYTVNQRICKITPTDIHNKFLFYVQNRNKYFLAFDDGVKQTNLRKDTVLSFPVYFPKNPKEQQKIANCLSSLDKVITAETEKLDLLKDHKKGLLQQLFPAVGETQPKFRFPEFKNDEDWEKVSLGEICMFTKGKGLPKSEIIDNGTLPCVHYGQLFTEYTEVISTVKSFTDLKNGVLSKKNDVLMPTSDVTPKGLAKASCIKDENVVLGGDILIIRPNEKKVFGEFLSRYIRHLENEVLKYVSGSTVFHLYASSMKLLELFLPSIKEQQKIAQCISAVDELLEAQEKKIEQLQEHKKGLLQQLFPKVQS